MRIHLDTDLGGDTDDACAEASLTTLRLADPVVGDERHWPASIAPRPSPPGAALDLLDRGIQAGATVVAIGPWTNLALLEVARPGRLARVPVVAMGGWTQPPAAGPLGELLARQGQAHGQDHDMAELGRAHPGLPDDLLNFQYDPVACAVAAGWPGAVVREQRLRPVQDGAVLRFPPDPDAPPIRVVVDLDAAAFSKAWLTAVEAAQPGTASSP